MEPLTEKYRPRCLAEVFGQGYVTSQLEIFLESPYSVGMMFSGRTGTGKTSIAYALAGELGISIADGEWGGFFSIPSGDQTAETVRETVRKARTTPMGSRDGWRLILVNEADRMGKPVRYLWLDLLEDLPPKTIVVFTTNHEKDFEDRFLDRLERYELAHDGPTLLQDAQGLIVRIWARETGSADLAPRAESLPGLVDKDGAISMRRVVTSLTAPLRAWRAAQRSAPVNVDRPAPEPARGRHDLNGAPLPSLETPAPRRVAVPSDSYALSSGEDPQRRFGHDFWATRVPSRG